MNKNRTFRIATPDIVFGMGALAEIGARARLFGVRHAAVITDPILAAGTHLDGVERSLQSEGIAYSRIADLEVEPTDRSFQKAAQDLAGLDADMIISVGGGSVIDTAKAANLYASAPAPFLDYVNAPIGLGRTPDRPLLPHIACPTTCGTGSECTGIAVFDLLSQRAKTGIMSRALLPDLAIADPTVTKTLPLSVLVATALDAMSHALEAYTCKSFEAREAAPEIGLRPMTQGANPWSDNMAEISIRTIASAIRPAIDEHQKGQAGDVEARGQLMWAASLAGNAFGNAGCHLPHALSYPISGMVRHYRPADWPPGPPLIPHGLSVLLTAPACYRLTAEGDPGRHRNIAQWLGLNPASDPGEAIADWVERIMADAGLPKNLGDIGYGPADLPALVAGALPQKRLLDNAPCEVGEATLKRLFTESM